MATARQGGKGFCHEQQISPQQVFGAYGLHPDRQYSQRNGLSCLRGLAFPPSGLGAKLALGPSPPWTISDQLL